MQQKLDVLEHLENIFFRSSKKPTTSNGSESIKRRYEQKKVLSEIF